MPKVKVSKNELWRAIRSQCLECCGGSPEAVRDCTSPKCSLYPYRTRPGKSEQAAAKIPA